MRLNFKFRFECVDCGAAFLHASPDQSVQSVDVDGPDGETTSARAVLLFVPDTCPQCHNLRVVPSGPKEVQLG